MSIDLQGYCFFPFFCKKINDIINDMSIYFYLEGMMDEKI